MHLSEVHLDVEIAVWVSLLKRNSFAVYIYKLYNKK